MHAPDLLQTVKLVDASKWCHTNARLPSLTAWLLRHGRHVRSLELDCGRAPTDPEAYTWELAACLGALVVARSLQRLSVSCSSDSPDLCVTSWGVALRQLKSLRLLSCGELRICRSLAGLSAVTELELRGEVITVEAAAQLPPNVEQLSLSVEDDEELPHQVGPAGSCVSCVEDERW